jgi:hypothetical protein
MKHIKTLAVVSVLGLAIGGFAIAQGHRAVMQHHHGDAASAAKHLSEAFVKFAPFDANKDGQFNAAEKESIAKAITEGTLQIPAHTPPKGVKPNAETFLNHIADVFAFLASQDVNHDGAIDATEQAAIKSAIEKGELARFHRNHSHGDRGLHH